jgi:hypothetical protein
VAATGFGKKGHVIGPDNAAFHGIQAPKGRVRVKNRASIVKVKAPNVIVIGHDSSRVALARVVLRRTNSGLLHAFGMLSGVRDSVLRIR